MKHPVFLSLVLGLLIIMIICPTLAGETRAYTPDELIALNGIKGWGDIGKLDTSREITAPGNKSGFSLKFTWENKSKDYSFWHAETGIPHRDDLNLDDYDRFVCDLFVESTDNKVDLCIYLEENDGDRWICWRKPLNDAPIGKWLHIEINRDDMELWPLGNKKREWNQIKNVSIEPYHNKAVYYVDNIRLLGPGGKELDVISDDNDGFPIDKLRSEPIHNPPLGTTYFACIAGKKTIAEKLPLKFNGLLGKFGTSGLGVATVHALNEWNVATVGYTVVGDGYTKFLTKHQAWDVNYAGESYNKTPFTAKNFNGPHCVAYAHPAVTQVMENKIDALAKSGIGACMLVDYTFPYANGPFGYAPSMIEAYHKDLTGEDEGLHIKQNSREQVIHFHDYFRAYNGFRVKPEDIGIKQWSEYTPWKPGDEGAFERSNRSIFFYLRSYEWLKLPDRVGRYYRSKGGLGMWIVPNTEDMYGSSDYVFISRSVGSSNLFPEWFGNVGFISEAAYASIPYYLREEADKSGNRFSILFETGATGHSTPYWEWQVAYTGSYVLSAISRADDYDNDFIDGAAYETQSDPKNAELFNRFRDGVAKAFAYQQARREKAKRGKARILCVSERPPSRGVNSIFFTINQPNSLGLGLSRTHFLFDLRDSLDLEKVIDRYKVLFYCPISPRVGDLTLIRRWLDSKPGRCLVTHSYVPTRDAKGFWGFTRDAQLGNVDGGSVIGLGRITRTEAKQCKVISAKGIWAKYFKTGEVINLQSGLTKCEHGEPLVMTDAGPLITQAVVGKGRVIYLHFTSDDPTNPDFLSVSKRISFAVGEESDIKPLCDADDQTLVQALDVPGGRSAVVWDILSLGKWNFEYRPGISPLEYSAPGVNKTVRLTVNSRSGYLVYDFWADKQSRILPSNGYIEVNLKDHLTGLYYYGLDSPSMRATIDNARKIRHKMQSLRF